MDYFYTVVIVIAVILLILCLIAVGIALQNQGKNEVFPKYQTPCPDGWAVDASGCILNSINVGTYDFSFNNPTYDSTVWDNSNNVPNLSGRHQHIIKEDGTHAASVCEKKAWANRNGIIWDGVSNYNQCDD